MSKRIGVHLGTGGGASNAVEKAREIGANTFQFFSSSPRMWRGAQGEAKQGGRVRSPRAALGVSPIVIHTSYLLNVCSQAEDVRVKSVAAFRAEIERALEFGADYLVLHPGSWNGLTRELGLKLAADSIKRAIDGLPFAGTGFHILIANTAGGQYSLGGSFEQGAGLGALLRASAPVGVCLDTCHTHVAGYDMVTDEGYAQTMKLIAGTVGFEAVQVWHCNDAKAPLGSKLDRHEHIGQGTMGVEPFRRLLNDARFAHAAFIAETPVDEPGDEERNVRVLKSLLK